MSRYNLPHPSKEHVSIAYGFDAPLSEYFYVVTDNDPELSEDERGDIGKVLDGDAIMACTRSRLLEVLTEEFQLPLDHPHVRAVAYDLPF